ncbi:hypothetical protein NYO91_09405 [Arhodomonas aquaeolei]|uniref:hypothetical protein n=1 Tax=Arhodomonas aquaeolei TaxID=2369 RepID=UPI0021681B89|nr:hypothetical protein [Arhodomonas aquaeolei]MCS4504292.1 hypothetical protein [Arhodomonas aquaeolei]
MGQREKNYRTLAALAPVQKVVVEAGKAVNDQGRKLADNEIPEILGVAGGAGLGAATGAQILSVSAAAGTSGAAALTSGLSTAGALVGGGMGAGIGVVASPAVVLAVGGYWALSRRNHRRLAQRKEALLQEAITKRDALLRELHNRDEENQQRVEYLNRLVVQLEAAIENLQADMAAA